MKRILLSILVIGILLLSACGAPTTSPPPASSTPSETASPGTAQVERTPKPVVLKENTFLLRGPTALAGVVVENPKENPAISATVEVLFYDAEGKLMRSAKTFPAYLLPGERRGIVKEVDMPSIGVVNSMQVHATIDRCYEVKIKPGLPIKVVVREVQEKETDYFPPGYTCKVEVVNPYEDVSLSFGGAMVLAYDELGQLVGLGNRRISYPAHETFLAPSSSMSLVVPFAADAKPEHVEVYLGNMELSAKAEGCSVPVKLISYEANEQVELLSYAVYLSPVDYPLARAWYAISTRGPRIFIIGELQNNTSDYMDLSETLFRTSVRAYDESGYPVELGPIPIDLTLTCFLDAVPPGGKVPFMFEPMSWDLPRSSFAENPSEDRLLQIEAISNLKGLELEFFGRSTEEREIVGVELQKISMETGDVYGTGTEHPYVLVELQNKSYNTYDGFKFIITFYDDSGNIQGVGFIGQCCLPPAEESQLVAGTLVWGEIGSFQPGRYSIAFTTERIIPP